MTGQYDNYEDQRREERKTQGIGVARHSPYCDWIYVESSVTPGVRVAARITKPAAPSYLLASTHGWHMSAPPFEYRDAPDPNMPYLHVEVDMRGRAFSEGEADCNGDELMDVIDVIRYVEQHYADYLIDPRVRYFEAGSGGGGNAMAIAAKFPDFFAAVTALCGMSDYALWYDEDESGEFRDEMDVWIGCSPEENPEAYAARSGLSLLPNVIAPMFLAHGETDIRVPAKHSRRYVERAQALGKEIVYMELPGVGTRSHWGHATAEQMDEIAAASEAMRQAHRCPVRLPRQGQLLVGGYVVTEYCAVRLASQDHMALLHYDVDAGVYRLEGKAGRQARIDIYEMKVNDRSGVGNVYGTEDVD